MGWRRAGTQPPHTSSLPVSLCSSLPLFLLPARHYKIVLSAPDASFKAEITARPPPRRQTKTKKEQPGKDGVHRSERRSERRERRETKR